MAKMEQKRAIHDPTLTQGQRIDTFHTPSKLIPSGSAGATRLQLALQPGLEWAPHLKESTSWTSLASFLEYA